MGLFQAAIADFIEHPWFHDSPSLSARLGLVEMLVEEMPDQAGRRNALRPKGINLALSVGGN
jgi:hypothetical protein